MMKRSNFVKKINFQKVYLFIYFVRFMDTLIYGSWQETTRKNPKNFRLKYCFHFRGISGAFPRDTVAGIFDLGRYNNCL